jgi:1-aminocyclopropane-1-carboxylate deaminase
MKALESEMNLHPGLEVLTLPAGKVWIQRDDLIHPIISGNKWRKLEGHLTRMRQQSKTCLLTFGGAYSNHLVATAVAAQLMGYKSYGILRGEESMDNAYLRVARGAGMEIVGVPRSLYRDKTAALSFGLLELGLCEEKVYVVDEGGKGAAGFDGFKGLVGDWMQRSISVEHIFHASATATTAVGLRKAMDIAGMNAKIHAVMVLKNLEEQLSFAVEHGVEAKEEAVLELGVCVRNDADSVKLSFVSGYAFGGYAKVDEELRKFMAAVKSENPGIPVEGVYTGKALYALNAWLVERVALSSEFDASVTTEGGSSVPHVGTVVEPLIVDVHGVFPVVFLHTGGVLQMEDYS